MVFKLQNFHWIRAAWNRKKNNFSFNWQQRYLLLVETRKVSDFFQLHRFNSSLTQLHLLPIFPLSSICHPWQELQNRAFLPEIIKFFLCSRCQRTGKVFALRCKMLPFLLPTCLPFVKRCSINVCKQRKEIRSRGLWRRLRNHVLPTPPTVRHIFIAVDARNRAIKSMNYEMVSNRRKKEKQRKFDILTRPERCATLDALNISKRSNRCWAIKWTLAI